MIDIAKISEMDHFVTLIDDSEVVFNIIKMGFEQAGFPVGMEAGKSGENFSTVTVFSGRSYLELLQISKDGAPDWPDEINQWNREGKRGILMLFLRAKDLDEIYNELKTRGIPVNEPYRDYYKSDGEKKSFPWRFMDLPVMGQIPLWIRWIQYDTMLWNMHHTGLKPNSRDLSGIDGFDSLKITGSFSDDDFQLLEKIFPELKENEENSVILRNGNLTFKKGDRTHFAFRASTENGNYKGQSMNAFNFSIDVD